MRGRMSVAKSYAKGFELGEALGGGTVSEVVASNHPKFSPGDVVSAFGGWQDYSLSNGEGLVKIDPSRAPVTTALGVLGMPGLTAYAGLLNIGQPKPDETVVVAAAAGPVGATVGQIAKLKGCRVVGIASGDKTAYLTGELGFDAGLDRRSPTLKDDLRAACPGGIDVYLIAHYNDTQLPSGPDRMTQLMRMVLTKRLRIQGFIVTDFNSQYGDFQREVGGWLKEGKIKYREDIVDGLEKAPEAFIGLLNGGNFGKLIVKIAD